MKCRWLIALLVAVAVTALPTVASAADPLVSTGKPATASSQENTTNTPAKAFDQNTATRWASVSFTDPQWIYVDLGSSYRVSQVKLNWEAAFASGYRIEVSDNASTWTQIYSTTTGDGGIDNITGLDAVGRYVRMYGTTRGSPWGYSLFEMEVYAAAPVSTGKTATASSTEAGTTNTPAKAVDQNRSTRWASDSFVDPQWIYVDLGASYDIQRVRLDWEAAFASSYKIEVSNNATTWTQIYSTTTGDGGYDNLTGLSGSGRYVRMYGTVRGSPWGYSLYEMEVYGVPSAPPAADPLMISTTTNHTGYSNLEGYVIPSDTTQVCISLTNTPVKTGPVNFYVDGTFFHTENSAPWDLVNTDGAGNCVLRTFSVGSHTVRADWENGGTDSSTFSVASGGGGSGVDPSGENMPVGDITGWHQIASDNFPYNVATGNFPAGTNGKWDAYPDGWQNSTHTSTYRCQTTVCSVHDGYLDMFLHTVNGEHQTAVPILNLPGGIDRQYGRYAVRFTADSMPLYKAAWLLWPQSNNWPQDGEIDFPEGDFNASICAFMHHQGAGSGSDQDAFCTQTGFQGWHTAVTEWRAGSCKFFLDGVLIGQTTDRVPNTPMHWVLQTEGNLDQAPADSTQGHVKVDWATVYSPA